MIAAINGVFDVLGISSPLMITGKLLHSQACRNKLRWDEEVPEDISKMWNKWIEDLEKIKTVTIPRSVVGGNNTKLATNGFSDASEVAVCAAVYLVGTYDSLEISSNLLVAKSRIAPKELFIPN